VTMNTFGELGIVLLVDSQFRIAVTGQNYWDEGTGQRSDGMCGGVE